MRSHTAKGFWQCFERLPDGVQRVARRNYVLWRENPSHPSLRFRQVHPNRPIFSARVGIAYRAFGIRPEDDMIVWFWIGPHDEYERVIQRA